MWWKGRGRGVEKSWEDLHRRGHGRWRIFGGGRSEEKRCWRVDAGSFRMLYRSSARRPLFGSFQMAENFFGLSGPSSVAAGMPIKQGRGRPRLARLPIFGSSLQHKSNRQSTLPAEPHFCARDDQHPPTTSTSHDTQVRLAGARQTLPLDDSIVTRSSAHLRPTLAPEWVTHSELLACIKPPPSNSTMSFLDETHLSLRGSR